MQNPVYCPSCNSILYSRKRSRCDCGREIPDRFFEYEQDILHLPEVVHPPKRNSAAWIQHLPHYYFHSILESGGGTLRSREITDDIFAIMLEFPNGRTAEIDRFEKHHIFRQALARFGRMVGNAYEAKGEVFIRRTETDYCLSITTANDSRIGYYLEISATQQNKGD